MKRRLVLALSLAATVASAQPMAPPAGMPADHPPVGGARTPGAALQADSSQPSPELPKGTIEVRVVDPGGTPRTGDVVRLGIVKQTVAEGEARDFKATPTNLSGVARFDGLATGSRYSYRVTVRSEAAEYASEPIQLREEMGQAIVLHVYPVTSDIRQAKIGLRGLVSVEPRDDVFQFEVMFRVFNVGGLTWVPADVALDLPAGMKGFTAQEGMSDTRFVADGNRARLRGTFAPGQHDVSFRFQVPNGHRETVSFQMSLPPHVAELQVLAEAARGMGLEATGFEPAQLGTSQDGRRVLSASRRLAPGEPEMRDLELRLTGVPTPGPGRWYAAGLAALLALAGLGVAARSALSGNAGLGVLSARDVAAARKLILDEVVALEQARRADRIGPRTYQQARAALLAALARLVALAPEKPRKKPSAAA